MRAGLRAATGIAVATFAIVAGARTAAAQTDPVFAPADAEELASVLAEAAEGQKVCYGWDVIVNDEFGSSNESRGSNDGAGRPIDTTSSRCDDYVRFSATINYTSESSESEDSASWSVESSSPELGTDDLESLELISEEGLVGDNVDADVAKAVAALPQLAADAGIAKPIEASPAAEGEAGDAALTDDPDSDFWRQTGMVLVWGALLVIAGVVFGVYAFRSSRRESYVSANRWADRDPEPRVRLADAAASPEIPAYVPPEWQEDTAYRRPADESTSDSMEAAESPAEAVPAAEVESTDLDATAPTDDDAEPTEEAEPGTDTATDPGDDTEPPATPPKS